MTFALDVLQWGGGEEGMEGWWWSFRAAQRNGAKGALAKPFAPRMEREGKTSDPSGPRLAPCKKAGGLDPPLGTRFCHEGGAAT
jgi:hypothetical protein